MMPALQLKVYGLVLATTIFELLTDHKSLGKNNTQQKNKQFCLLLGVIFFRNFTENTLSNIKFRKKPGHTRRNKILPYPILEKSYHFAFYDYTALFTS